MYYVFSAMSLVSFVAVGIGFPVFSFEMSFKVCFFQYIPNSGI